MRNAKAEDQLDLDKLRAANRRASGMSPTAIAATLRASEKHKEDMDKIVKERAERAAKHCAVNSPAHYDVVPGVEVVDIIKAKLTAEEYKGWLKGNSIKYLLRADEKGKPAQDRQKCKWMLDRLLDL